MSDDDICTGYDFETGHECDRQVADAPIAACVHEHMGPRPLCQYHLADLAHGLMNCGDCKECTDPHECVLVAVPVRSLA